MPIEIPNWWMKGDWFDVCSCNVPCPCSFSQVPTNNHCEWVMAYHVREGAYGDVRLDGLNVIVIVTLEWSAKNDAGYVFSTANSSETNILNAFTADLRSGVFHK